MSMENRGFQVGLEWMQKSKEPEQSLSLELHQTLCFCDFFYGQTFSIEGWWGRILFCWKNSMPRTQFSINIHKPQLK